jgi:hypothetical protein
LKSTVSRRLAPPPRGVFGRCLAFAWFIGVAGVGLGAQEAPAPALPAPGPLSPAEIQRLFDAYTVVQAQEMLKLDDVKYGQFVVRLKALQETRRRSQGDRQRLLQELNRLTRPEAPTDETTVRDQLRALQDHEARAMAELRRAYDALDQVLDVRQQARFRVFEEQMERRKFELLLRARQQINRPNQRRVPPPEREP